MLFIADPDRLSTPLAADYADYADLNPCKPRNPRLKFFIHMTTVVIALLLLQWVGVRLPNVPRTADGKPNLSAPAPKTPDGKPDLTGLWRNPDGRYLDNLAAAGSV